VAAVAVLGITAASSGGLLLAQTASFRAAPTVPLCLVATTGGAVEGYADALGLGSGTVLTPDIGGVALTTRMVVVDMAGLAEPTIARFWRDGDMAGLRDHVFDDVRPTFITSHSTWSAQTGLPDDARMAADYLLVTSIANGGQWVRRDVLRRPGDLEAVRRVARDVVLPADAAMRAAPRASCGTTLGAAR
jgi:hypothetical protein